MQSKESRMIEVDGKNGEDTGDGENGGDDCLDGDDSIMEGLMYQLQLRLVICKLKIRY